ncbi:BEN domain-containing protein 6 isoform X1 [Caretta caretta]|uniref:BEN domain-containing protein 6 isoform X1 n=3 Tax=Caretta caretta TaxID=8467 RepID=UPI002095BD83|nr:BEN domain-containing protein 6 isoform X1 [Caretta caretta]XP_048701202.1 BEN domain-containing protein 6 isoform X1 [Caretta caretta]XP_048701203.1 BEN domain-containing protein 6 isoform X1 [Caretta caretta]XP_048701204.1 BEN domain-containing protein 6 isoform X1 [Caretta caretta]
MKKFTLFDFVNDNSLQIGETSWIQDLPNDDSELEGLLKPNEQVLVNWPVGERKTEKHLVKVVYMSVSSAWTSLFSTSDDPQELVEMMQKILQADEITKIQVVGKGKRKRIEMIFSESEDSDLDKGQGKMMKSIKRKKSLQASASANILSQLETSLINKQREPYSGNAFLYSESSSDDEEPLFQLSKVELRAKIKSLKRKLTDTMRENCRLRQSLVMLQVLPQAVTHFEELVGMAEALLKGGVTTSASSIHSHTVWKASNSSLSDSYATIHSNSNSPIALNMEEEEQQPEKQFKIEKWQIALCNKSKPQKFINDLMQALYTHEYMATHSLTGAKSSSSKDKAAKPAMNQNEVQEIIGITKQLFPNTDDALIRRMMGQKLNNCTKKPILSKDLNSVVFQKHSFCGSPAPPPSTQDTIPSAPVSSAKEQQDDDSLASPTPVQHGDSSLAPPPHSTQAQQSGVTPTSFSMESHQGRNSPAPTSNQGSRQDFRSSDKK